MRVVIVGQQAFGKSVLEAFIEWDIECFSKLRGMFAVALWSESRRRLVLARDRMGIKPLYVARRGADLLFGSELKTIFVHPEFDRRLDPAALDCYLAMNYVPAPLTMLEGVEKLEQGTWLEWRSGETPDSRIARPEKRRVDASPSGRWDCGNPCRRHDDVARRGAGPAGRLPRRKRPQGPGPRGIRQADAP